MSLRPEPLNRTKHSVFSEILRFLGKESGEGSHTPDAPHTPLGGSLLVPKGDKPPVFLSKGWSTSVTPLSMVLRVFGARVTPCVCG